MKSHDTFTPTSTASVQDDSRDEIKRDIGRTATALSPSETVSRYGSANAEFVKAYRGVDNEAGKVLSKGLKGISQEKTGVKQRAGWAGLAKLPVPVVTTPKPSSTNLLSARFAAMI